MQTLLFEVKVYYVELFVGYVISDNVWRVSEVPERSEGIWAKHLQGA